MARRIAIGVVVASVWSASAWADDPQGNPTPGGAARAQVQRTTPQADGRSLSLQQLRRLRQILLGARQALQRQDQAQLQASLKKAAASVTSGYQQPGASDYHSSDPLACENTCQQALVQCQADVALSVGEIGSQLFEVWSLPPGEPHPYIPPAGSNWSPFIYIPDLPNHCTYNTRYQSICNFGVSGLGELAFLDTFNGCPDVNSAGYYGWEAQLYTILSGPLKQCTSQWSACASKC